MHKTIAMPDCITFDMVKAAMVALGLDPNRTGKLHVMLSFDEVVVTATANSNTSKLVRTYEIGNWATRYQPAEETPDGVATTRR